VTRAKAGQNLLYKTKQEMALFICTPRVPIFTSFNSQHASATPLCVSSLEMYFLI
jgi:hypothetical protein